MEEKKGAMLGIEVEEVGDLQQEICRGLKVTQGISKKNRKYSFQTSNKPIAGHVVRLPGGCGRPGQV